MPCKQIQVQTSDLRVNGALAPDEIDIPSGELTDRNFIPYARLPEELLEHQQAISYWQLNGVAVVDETIVVHTFRRAGTILAVSVIPIAIPTGAKTIGVDVQLGNAADDYATVLASVVTINASSTARTPQAGILAVANTPVADGDTLLIDVNASGASGTQGQGLNVIVWIRENG